MNTPEHIEGCHSCGAAPEVSTVDGFTRIECKNPQCDLAIRIETRPRNVAIERWNRRADPKLHGQIRTLRAFLWSVLALGDGTAVVPDELLTRSMTPDAILLVRTKGNTTHLRSVLAQETDEAEREQSQIIQLDKRIIRPGDEHGN